MQSILVRPYILDSLAKFERQRVEEEELAKKNKNSEIMDKIRAEKAMTEHTEMPQELSAQSK